MIGACAGSGSGVPGGLRRAECPEGIRGAHTHGVQKSVWDVMLAFQWLSIVAYGTHFCMAWKVHRVVKGRRDRGEIEAVDPDEEEARRQKARDLWNQQYRMEGL